MSRWRDVERWAIELTTSVVCETQPIRRFARDREHAGVTQQDRQISIRPASGNTDGVMRAAGPQVPIKASVQAQLRVRYPTLTDKIGTATANAQIVSDGTRLVRAISAASAEIGEGETRQSATVTVSNGWRLITDTDGVPAIAVDVRIRYEEAAG